MVGQRTRVALEREKMMALRSIKELEFDRAMGRLSDEDWREMSGRLRSRAARLMRQLDAGSGYREQIEKDLAKRLAETTDARLPAPRSAEGKGSRSEESVNGSRSESAATADTPSAKALAERVCPSCETANDTDARFCKGCGQRLG
jgi:hypothetical protein